jgi:hypothetical protein
MTTVFIEVTLVDEFDADRTADIPAGVSTLMAAAPGVQRAGFVKHGSRPWRARFLVRGPDCVATARTLEQMLSDIGYEAEAVFLR